jgi:hypothetical protein
MASLKSLLAKLDYQHVLLFLVFAVSVVLPDVVKLEDAFGLGQFVPVTMRVLADLTFVVGLLKQFQPTAEGVLSQASRLSSRGFARLHLLALLSLAALLFAIAACSGCSWLQSPGGQKVETVTFDTAVCILNHVKDPPAQIAVECGVATIEDVVKVLDAHRAAMVREGFVLPPSDAGASWQLDGLPSIPVLFERGSPPNVPGLVVAVDVNPVDRVLRAGALPHIGKESVEATVSQPTRAHGNASASVVFTANHVGVAASSGHRAPGAKLWCGRSARAGAVGQSHVSSSVEGTAAARLSVSCAEIVRRRFRLGATVASAKPERLPSLAADPVLGHQSAEPLSAQV